VRDGTAAAVSYFQGLSLVTVRARDFDSPLIECAFRYKVGGQAELDDPVGFSSNARSLIPSIRGQAVHTPSDFAIDKEVT
jgi:hypothetical protein